MRTSQNMLNVGTSALTWVVMLGISFVLTPYIVRCMGTAAYGFINLSNNIVGYTTVLGVSLAGVAARHVAAAWHNGNRPLAAAHLHSALRANTLLTLSVVTVLGITTLFIDHIMRIPAPLVRDLQTLLLLLFVNAVVEVTADIPGISAFVCNRLDIQNWRIVGAKMVRAAVLVLLYALLPPRLWYFGAAALAAGLFAGVCNVLTCRRLTPQLLRRTAVQSTVRARSMAAQGIGNAVTQLGALVNQGVELLIANLMISPHAMGVLAIGKMVPWLILQIMSTLAANINPTILHLHNTGQHRALRATLLRSMTACSLVASVPCAILLAWGNTLYAWWMPAADSAALYAVTAVAIPGILIAIPAECLWYAFVITDTTRSTAVETVIFAGLNIAADVALVWLASTPHWQLMAIPAAQTVLYALRFTLFVPRRAAAVLHVPYRWLLVPAAVGIAATALLTGLLKAVSIIHFC